MSRYYTGFPGTTIDFNYDSATKYMLAASRLIHIGKK